jgi:hypothetical protein
MATIMSMDNMRSIRMVEYLAAGVIFCIVAVVLYVVFIWKPF